MRIASEKSKEHGMREGVTIARETLAREKRAAQTPAAEPSRRPASGTA